MGSYIKKEFKDKTPRIDGIELHEQHSSGLKENVKRMLIRRHLKNGKILDIGCGAGTVSRGLSDDITGIDISDARLEQAKKNGLKVYKGDVCNLPFEDKTFDVVIAADIIEHVQRPYDMLIEANRVLKDNGQLFLETPNAINLDRLLRLIFSTHPKEESPNHIFLFDRIVLSEMLKRSGFEIKKLYGFGITFPGWRFIFGDPDNPKERETIKQKRQDKGKNVERISLSGRLGLFLGRIMKPLAYSFVIYAEKKVR